MVISLESERQRSRAVSTKDSDTILELRTALEVTLLLPPSFHLMDDVCQVEKEQGSRLALDVYSPHPGGRGMKSGQGSRLSLYGSRGSLPGHKSPNLIPEVTHQTVYANATCISAARSPWRRRRWRTACCRSWRRRGGGVIGSRSVLR